MKLSKKRITIILFIIFIFICLFSAPVQAQEFTEENADVTLSPYFYVESGDLSTDYFPLKDTNVLVNINGTIAETFLTQTYTNEGQNPINAVYIFPASTKVTVHGMKMQIGDQLITAQIQEKEIAKETYEEAKSEGKNASLLEQKRSNVFQMNVANIMPGDTVQIELHYTELISAAKGSYQFVFPTVVGPRYVSTSDTAAEEPGETDPWAAVPYLEEGREPSGSYQITVNLSAGVPITSLTSKSHAIQVDWENEAAAQVTLSDTEDYAGNRDYILDYKLTGEEVDCGLMLHTAEEENFFMLMVQPPERIVLEEIPPREYIFILDVSGSMYGYPLETAKEVIQDLVSNLRETDIFNLILFSDQTMKMSPKSAPATKENINRAIHFIEDQEGGGGTELLPAFRSALKLPRTEQFARTIITITDGYIYDETSIFEAIHKNLDTTNFFSFGIGDSVNRALIEGIAKAGQGESFIVTDSADAKETASRFRTYVQSPLLTDIQVSYEGFDVYDLAPNALPTLFAQRPLLVYGKFRGEPSGTIQITGRTGNQPYQKTIQVADIEPLASNQAIRYLWARSRVDQLMDYGLNTDVRRSVKKEITALGLQYHMVTPYTSFIAVMDTVRNPEGESSDIAQPLPLPSKVSNLAIGGYSVGSEPDIWLLIFLLASMLLIRKLYQWRFL